MTFVAQKVPPHLPFRTSSLKAQRRRCEVHVIFGGRGGPSTNVSDALKNEAAGVGMIKGLQAWNSNITR